MMAGYNEKPFEDELCAHLEANGWLYSPNGTGYDKARALFPEDVFGWLEDTQPAELAKVVKPGASEKERQQSRGQLLDRMTKVLDKAPELGGGTLALLRQGFKHTAAKFSMAEFKPATLLNPATLERYGKVRVRVVRQVHYSVKNGHKSFDLVLFMNGIPVATMELKTDFTQSVQDAMAQYKKDRLPQGEPLLGFGTRALVHFAVSNDEVWMTTKLAGNDTFFLPFNRGFDEGAGNPPNPSGSKSAYLWERVLQRDSWLDIIGRFLHTVTEESSDPITGKVSKSTSILFPRYHQWEAVTRLLDAAKAEGAGGKYLIQHSAGSGKTNSISWSAHRLATLHNEANGKVFDSVIVVTDRTVLDSQLQDAIRQIDRTAGTVATINDRDAAKVMDDQGNPMSKSKYLAKMLIDGTLIIVVTIQTFPFALEVIRNTKGLPERRFAVIADEAHSSQTGGTAGQLKKVLSSQEQADLADGGGVDTEAILAADQEQRAESKNISFFAFTATPKPKTMDLFGTLNPETGKKEPFHTYSMQQAIEEGFILDVLRNYTDYDTAFQIAMTASDGQLTPAKGKQGDGTGDGSATLVDESAATKGLMRWVKLHPTNIAQKVQIIVEHFRVNVEDMLEGHAKAMVVTDSRKAAVRYKIAIDKYIAKQGYTEIGTLVAFSGEVEDTDTGPDKFTENNMNPGLKGRDLRTAFNTDEYKVMLVANKFQTGFDQPLLCAMYVDKQLSGVTAVQTLSRLNRTYPKAGKDTTYVLDFVNNPDDILAAFQPYYRAARLDTATDPNLVHDLESKLAQADVYTDDEVQAAAEAWILGKGNNALTAAITPAVDRYKERYVAAVQDGDKTATEALDVFRRDVSSYVRLYDFMSQIINYGDTDLEKLAIYLRLLERRIRPEALNDPIDLTGVELRQIKQTNQGVAKLDLKVGDSIGLVGITALGSGAARDPRMVKLEDVLHRINELFSDEDFTQAQKTSWVESLLRSLLEDGTLLDQARANTKQQFLESPDLAYAITSVLLDNQTNHTKMFDKYAGSERIKTELVSSVGDLVYDWSQDKPTDA